jgi:mRNA (guanine-N7-)-methyltransferase
MITFELEEEKFPLFGKRYQLKFSGDNASEDHCLVHFPSLIRLAREAGLEFVEIQSLTDFYDDNRAQFASLLMNAGPNFVDPRGKLLPRAFDLLGLYATFIFQKPDPDIEPPLTTPIPFESSNNHDEASTFVLSYSRSTQV